MNEMAKERIQKLWEKVDKLLETKSKKTADLSRMTGLRPGRFSKWRGGTGVPSAVELLHIAQALCTSMEYLSNDALSEEPTYFGVPDDERRVLDFYRNKRDQGLLTWITATDALSEASRQNAKTPGKSSVKADAGEVAKLIDPKTGGLLQDPGKKKGVG